MKMQLIALPIPADHPAFAGHFPGMPIVPGVVLLDEALYAIGAALGMDLSACQVSTVKFLSPVRPGEPVQVSFEKSSSGAVKFDIVSGERKIATGALRMQKGG
jgi:3-hydroxyacyl-[acyl-carrier-protein] dehydratase